MLNRREFLNFIGYAGATAGISIPQIGLADFTKTLLKDKKLPDDIILKPGFSYRPILQWGDAIGNGLRFGYNNDYICIQELGPNEIIMMVNHETINPKLMQMRKDELTKEVFNEERKEVGISSVVLKKVKDKWELESNHPLNNRLDAHSEIPFANNKKIAASDKAIGTLANCAGGKTPWGTFLTCEENY